MVSVAVIDDGIWVNNKSVMEKLNISYTVCEDGNVTKENPKKIFSKPTHGGLCSYILLDIFQEVSLTSLHVLGMNGRGSIERLCAALEWCIWKDYEVIHMSLTTRNYRDYIRLQPLIEELRRQGRGMVASLDNGGNISYPAGFAGVQAVFMDTKDLSCGDRVGIFYDPKREQKFLGVNYNKTLVMDDYTAIRVGDANSFAAPVITGYLARYMSAGIDTITAEKMLERKFLQSGMKSIRISGVNKRKTERSIPAICVIGESIDLAVYSKEYFESDGYQVACFSEKEIDGFVPLQFYLENHIFIDEAFLNDMADIYEADLIICHICRESDICREVVEILLSENGNRIEIFEDNRKKGIFNMKREALQCVKKELQEG